MCICGELEPGTEGCGQVMWSIGLSLTMRFEPQVPQL